MKILLHTCCAPCSIKCIETLRKEGEVHLFWYNPNIHPYTEYAARRDALRAYAEDKGLPLTEHGEYGLNSYLNKVWPDIDSRCAACYKMRLEATAEYAAQNGYDTFSTTLLISPYQDHNLIITTAEQAAEKYKVPFLYRDFRPYFRQRCCRFRL